MRFLPLPSFVHATGNNFIFHEADMHEVSCH